MDNVSLVRLALQIVSERLLTMLALCLNFSLGCWTMWGLQWERLVAMAVFALFSYLVIVKERNANERQAA